MLGPKFQADVMGFCAGPNCCFYHDIVILCRDIVVFVMTLLVYVAT